jgi:hypothetical protein
MLMAMERRRRRRRSSRRRRRSRAGRIHGFPPDEEAFLDQINIGNMIVRRIEKERERERWIKSAQEEEEEDRKKDRAEGSGL